MSIPDYNFQAEQFEVTPEMKDAFLANGYVLVRNLLNEAELRRIRGVLESGAAVKEHTHDLEDGADKKSRMCLWNQPGSDVTGMLARSEKVAGTCEKLLGGEVYHYHTKLMMKEAVTGGRFMWHQDYGYWYENTCLFPDLMTVFLALDPCRKDNGCLQILSGSNRCGRIKHSPSGGGQMEADPDRVEQLKARCEHLHVQLQPGDALFFHCNLLHCSSQNSGPDRRWALLCAYNRADNDPVEPHFHPFYTKLHKVPNSAILDCALDWDTPESKDYLSQSKRDAGWTDIVQAARKS